MSEQAVSRTSPIHEVFPYLCVRDAGAAIEFYKKAFNAEEVFRLTEPSGRIGHCELKFGPLTIMLADEFPEYNILSPQAYGGAGSGIHIHVDNADAVAKQAVEAGAEMLSKPEDQFYGERSCRLKDPFGHIWAVGHEIEKVSPEEMQRRYTELCK
jgi:uncharacterized glyoxalase superfamily protein PhnB